MLGIEVKCNCSGQVVHLSQIAYINAILHCYNLDDLKLLFTPMDHQVQLSLEQVPTSIAECTMMRDVPYREAVSTLNWAVLAMHPDIAFAVSTVAHFTANPRPAHWEAVKWIFCYVKVQWPSPLDLLPPPSPCKAMTAVPPSALPSKLPKATTLGSGLDLASPPSPSSHPAFADSEDYSVFDLQAVLRACWFLSRDHLAAQVVSAQRGPSGDFDWVEFAPPYHTHLIKCATALLPPQLCSMKRLKGVLFAFVLEVLNSPVSSLDKFKRKSLGKKVCPCLDPSFKQSPSAGDKGPTSASPPGVCRRSSPAGPPPPAPASPVRAVGSVTMACDTPPPSSPTPSPRAQPVGTPQPSTPRALDPAPSSSVHPAFAPSRVPGFSRAPPKRPATFSPPPRPLVRFWPESGDSHPTDPNPVPPVCSCRTDGWITCRVHLTWDSSPLRALPHALFSPSIPFSRVHSFSPSMRDAISDCSACEIDPVTILFERRVVHLCRVHFSAFASAPHPLPPSVSSGD